MLKQTTQQRETAMKTTADYLAELKRKTGSRSDGATGLLLGWTRPATTNYKHNRRAFDNFTCLIVAQTLQIPIIQVIADMEIQRTDDPTRRRHWLPFATPPPTETEPQKKTPAYEDVTMKVTGRRKRETKQIDKGD